MVADHFYNPDENARAMSQEEAIRRIAPAFRRVTLDRVRADAELREQHERLLAMHAPHVILQSHMAQYGHWVWVSVTDDDEPDGWIEFRLAPDEDGAVVEYRSESDRERLRPTVLKLANLLGFHVAAYVPVAPRTG